MRLQLTTIILFAMAATSAPAQSFNIAIGPLANQPSSSYAAAGRPGYWNATPAYHNTNTYNLVKLDGTVTGVHIWQYGGTELRNTDDPATTGDDEQLMDHCQVTYTPGLETCVFFYDLINGDYEVLIYAMMPAQPAVKSWASSDEDPGHPHYIVGGAWPGQHQQGITFSRLIAHVTSGLLRTHSGIVPAQDPALGCAYNGVQIRLLPARSPGDMNCDGKVNAMDIGPFVNALANAPVYYSSQPTCRIDNADINNDSSYTPADIPGFLALLGL